MENNNTNIPSTVEDSNIILPPQPTDKNSHRNKIVIIEIVVSAIILMVIGFLLLQNTEYSENLRREVKDIQIPSPTVKHAVSTPTSMAKKIDVNVYNSSEELSNFPIYPKSLFVKKEKTDPCPNDEKSRYLQLCDVVTYTWQTSDDYDQVSKWFQEDPTHSGWKCLGGVGGYGGPRDATGVSFCTNNSIRRALQIYADETKTELILEIPVKEYKGKYIN